MKGKPIYRNIGIALLTICILLIFLESRYNQDKANSLQEQIDQMNNDPIYYFIYTQVDTSSDVDFTLFGEILLSKYGHTLIKLTKQELDSVITREKHFQFMINR